jgi:hypothetical protein
MTGIRFDAGWVGGYAKVAESSAEALDEGLRTVNSAPLTEESFGRLGTTVRTDEAYGRAAGLLREQLARGVEALRSAADGLTKVTAGYETSDDDNVETLRRGEQV